MPMYLGTHPHRTMVDSGELIEIRAQPRYRVWFRDGSRLAVEALSHYHARRDAKRIATAQGRDGRIARVERMTVKESL